ncbi:glycosyltransferase family 2 protein [Brucella thiophenivorans]|nr:glycosyltransferase family 2 protein [Brucella thiophenivorans]
MKIIGILLQRDEIDVVLFNVLYHLGNVGLNRIILGDNGSTDGSMEALRRLEKIDPRLMVLELPGEFEQAERVNQMYQLALDLGADWVVPLDADEFLSVNRRSLESLLLNNKATVLNLEIRNFVQKRTSMTKRMLNIATMIYTAVPSPSAENAMSLVCDGKIGFVEATYPPKYIWRADRQLKIWKGNHGGNISFTNKSPKIELYHVPLRSKSAIEKRIQRIERLEKGPPDSSWHIKRLATVDIDEEWRRNSYSGGALHVNGERHDVELNLFFLKIFLRFAPVVWWLLR